MSKTNLKQSQCISPDETACSTKRSPNDSAYNQERRELWKAVWIAMASSAIERMTQIHATAWADNCLEEFDKRFAMTTTLGE